MLVDQDQSVFYLRENILVMHLPNVSPLKDGPPLRRNLQGGLFFIRRVVIVMPSHVSRQWSFAERIY